MKQAIDLLIRPQYTSSKITLPNNLYSLTFVCVGVCSVDIDIKMS